MKKDDRPAGIVDAAEAGVDAMQQYNLTLCVKQGPTEGLKPPGPAL